MREPEVSMTTSVRLWVGVSGLAAMAAVYWSTLRPRGFTPDDTDLLHQVEQRRDAPVLGDFAADDPHGVDDGPPRRLGAYLPVQSGVADTHRSSIRAARWGRH